MERLKLISILLCTLFVFLQIQQIFIVYDNIVPTVHLYEIEFEGEDKLEKKLKQFEEVPIHIFQYTFGSNLLPKLHLFSFNQYLFNYIKLPDIPPEFS